MFSYKIGRINPPFYVINVIFFDKYIKYNLEIDVDFINKYKNYVFIDKVNNPYLTAINKNLTESNKNIIKGDIISIKSKNIINKTNNHYKYLDKYIKDNVEYKSSSQYEYDKYHFCIGNTNSNAELYKYIYEYMIELFKNDYINNKETEFVEISLKENKHKYPIKVLVI